jgi:hypothetical protein
MITNNSCEYIEEMDASTVCALVNTSNFTDYSQIVTSTSTGPRLIEFNMIATTSSPASSNSMNDFTKFITTTRNFPNGKPVLVSGSNIVTGYLKYPNPPGTGSSFSNDFYVSNSFRDLSSVVSNIIMARDLCSSNDIYSSTPFTGSSSISGLSLTTLYNIRATTNLNSNDLLAVNSNIDKYENKNKMFYSAFVYEYCYYNKMYTTLLQEYFKEYTSVSPSRLSNITLLRDSTNKACTTGTSNTDQASRLDGIVITLARVNSRMTDMRNLLSAIQNYYSAAVQTFQNTLNQGGVMGSDTHAENKVTYLMNQSLHVQAAKDDSIIRQGIMEYTSEKNRYSNILLGIYAFLNIAIIGVIFNIKE